MKSPRCSRFGLCDIRSNSCSPFHLFNLHKTKHFPKHHLRVVDIPNRSDCFFQQIFTYVLLGAAAAAAEVGYVAKKGEEKVQCTEGCSVSGSHIHKFTVWTFFTHRQNSSAHRNSLNQA